MNKKPLNECLLHMGGNPFYMKEDRDNRMSEFLIYLQEVEGTELCRRGSQRVLGQRVYHRVHLNV